MILSESSTKSRRPVAYSSPYQLSSSSPHIRSYTDTHVRSYRHLEPIQFDSLEFNTSIVLASPAEQLERVRRLTVDDATSALHVAAVSSVNQNEDTISSYNVFQRQKGVRRHRFGFSLSRLRATQAQNPLEALKSAASKLFHKMKFINMKASTTPLQRKPSVIIIERPTHPLTARLSRQPSVMSFSSIATAPEYLQNANSPAQVPRKPVETLAPAAEKPDTQISKVPRAAGPRISEMPSIRVSGQVKQTYTRTLQRGYLEPIERGRRTVYKPLPSVPLQNISSDEKIKELPFESGSAKSCNMNHADYLSDEDPIYTAHDSSVNCVRVAPLETLETVTVIPDSLDDSCIVEGEPTNTPSKKTELHQNILPCILTKANEDCHKNMETHAYSFLQGSQVDDTSEGVRNELLSALQIMDEVLSEETITPLMPCNNGPIESAKIDVDAELGKFTLIDMGNGCPTYLTSNQNRFQELRAKFDNSMPVTNKWNKRAPPPPPTVFGDVTNVKTSIPISLKTSDYSVQHS